MAEKCTTIGGQAVIEGVMMRGKKIYALAVRNPEGEIVIEKKPVMSMNKGIFKLPIFRGMAAFVDSLINGTKILMRSAEIAGEDWAEEELSPFEKWLMDKFGDKITDILIYFSVFLSLVLGMTLFFVLPVAIGNLFKSFVPSWALGVVEGLIRITIFLTYMWLISKMKEIQRVFQYHGAEHKTIACFEAGKELGMNIAPGMLFSGAAFHYPEGFLESWRDMGALAVEMETCALYMNAMKAGKEALTICTITDMIFTGEACTVEERQTCLNNMITVALKAATR